MQQLEHFVKACGVRHAGSADGERTLKTRNQVACEKCFTRPHPVAVALHSVDFTVVCNKAVRVSQWPRWERVRRETAMHQCKCRVHALIRKIREELLKLWRREHSLVHNRACRQRREVRAHRASEFMFNALASDENLAVKINACSTCRVIEEELTHSWHHGTSRCTQAIRIHRHIAPTQWTQTLFGHNLFNCGNCCRRIGW